MIVETEVERLKKFRDSLRLEDKPIFDDLLRQCKLYASATSSLASPVKEVSVNYVNSLRSSQEIN
jgi:hypothetical protein